MAVLCQCQPQYGQDGSLFSGYGIGMESDGHSTLTHGPWDKWKLCSSVGTCCESGSMTSLTCSERAVSGGEVVSAWAPRLALMLLMPCESVCRHVSGGLGRSGTQY